MPSCRMVFPRRFTFPVVLLASLLPIARPAHAAWSHDPGANLAVCSAANSQFTPVSCADGLGGAFIAWNDTRNSGVTSNDVYIQHVLKNGTADIAWPADGKVVCDAPGPQANIVMVPDGAGGTLLAWQDLRSGDNDVYAVHLDPNGVRVSGWPANGLLLSSSLGAGHLGSDQNPRIVADGIAGCYVAWTHAYSGSDFDPHITHVSSAGAFYSGYSTAFATFYDVNSVLTAEQNPSICADGSGAPMGVIVAYESNASGNYDILAERLGPFATIVWSTTITSNFGDQTGVLLASDGKGGALAEWNDSNSGNVNVLATRLGPSGLAPGWTSGGLQLAGTGSDEYALTPVADGGGGGYFAWYTSYFFFVVPSFQRLLPNGVAAPGWSSPLQPASSVAGGIALTSDGAGGLIYVGGALTVVTGPVEMVADRFTPNGALAAGWNSFSDLRICDAAGYRAVPTVTADGLGGFIAAWEDSRGGFRDIYAQRFEKFGQLGNPEPTIVGVKDVLNDQGGRVRVSWEASYLDSDPYYGVYEYHVWRQAPAAVAEHALRAGHARLEGDAEAASARGDPDGRAIYRIERDGARVYYWEQIAAVSAAQRAGYSLVASTTGDSIGGSNPMTPFMVDASSGGTPFWSSSPDSGYSVDNLPPVAPSPFTGHFDAGAGAYLTWGANGESDLAGYRLYKGEFAGFVPDPGNRIYQGALTSFHDVATHDAAYKVCAYDIHGNEGSCTLATPGGSVGLEGSSLPREWALVPGSANPARGAVDFRLELPRGGAVAFAIYDAQGRRVRGLVDGWREAGVHAVRWDARDETGARVANAVYFARLQAGGIQRVRRIVTMR